MKENEGKTQSGAKVHKYLVASAPHLFELGQAQEMWICDADELARAIAAKNAPPADDKTTAAPKADDATAPTI
ncbi:MAG: hypothetical protein JO206_01155 [Solirubrobacterales bacterium]|nr:hypothetical protein [Solirubrobacterales bacterium]MBV9837857.1 hypothetical protein [Solirubrobacterales bacterium]